MLKTHTVTTTYYQHRVIKAHDYECYGYRSIEAGRVLHTTKTPNRYKTYSQVIGHGMREDIPQHKVGVFKIDKRVTTTTKETLTETPCTQP